MFFHAIESTVTHTINATYARRMIGRLDVISSNVQQLFHVLIGCIFHGTVYLSTRLRGVQDFVKGIYVNTCSNI